MGRIIERVFCARLQTGRRWLIVAVMALTEHCETEAVISPRTHLEGIRPTVALMHATAWHNGGPPTDTAGYGIKFSETDRDH